MKITGSDFLLVPSRDYGRSAAFYGETLGLAPGKSYGQRPGGEWETGNLTLQILEMEAFGLDFAPSRNPLALHVEDVEEARSELEAKGVTFVRDTLDSGVCHMAFFEDPDGNVLCLHHRYAPPDARPA